MIATAVLLISVVYLFNGSLEMFPSEEQEEKVKIVSSTIAVFSLLADVIFIALRLKRK